MSLLELKIDQLFMQTHTASFELPMDDPKAYFLTEDSMLEIDGDFYYISRVKKVRQDNEAYLKIEADAAWYKLGERKQIGLFRLTNLTPEQGLQAILDAASLTGLSWSIGNVNGSIAQFSLEETDATYLDLIFQWAKVTSCEVGFDSRAFRVNFQEQIGGNYGLSFRYRRNLLGIEAEVTPPAVTRLYAYGRLGLTIAGANPSGEEFLEDYSFYTGQGMTLEEAELRFRKDDVYKDDSFVDEDSLYSAAQARLALLSQPQISYTARVADLSSVTGFAEADFQIGDTVTVFDEILGIDVTTRVSRYVRYPYEPSRNVVELSFLTNTLDDPDVSDNRSEASEWTLFEHRNTDTPLAVRSGYSIIHQIPLRAQQDAAWAVHATVYGTAVGNSTLHFVPIDPVSGVDWFPAFSKAYTDGELVSVDFSTAETAISPGPRVFALRVYSDTFGAGVDIQEKSTSLWIMARGAVRETVEADNSAVFEYTGEIQYFTVPDDIYEIRVTARGAQGGGDGTAHGSGGLGGLVQANFWVIPGQTYYVYVGGVGLAGGGWPNGGSSDGNSSGDNGWGGGGATYLIPELGSFTDALLVAGAGGGQGCHFSIVTDVSGGHAGFLAGEDGRGNSAAAFYDPDGEAKGATQTEGGRGGFEYGGGGGPWLPSGETGDTDGQGFGGDAGDTNNAFAMPGGGGGGGWHGGGGGGKMNAAGNKGGGGGGGSGYASSDAFDLLVEDAEHSGAGQMIISWDDPE